MTWFRRRIRGENLPGALVGEPGMVGFYVTRFVEAVDEDAGVASGFAWSPMEES